MQHRDAKHRNRFLLTNMNRKHLTTHIESDQKFTFIALLSATQEPNIGEDRPRGPPSVAEVYGPVLSALGFMQGHQQLKYVFLGRIANIPIRVIVSAILPFPRVPSVVAGALPRHGHSRLFSLRGILVSTDVHQRVAYLVPGVLDQQLCQDVCQFIQIRILGSWLNCFYAGRVRCKTDD